MSFMCINCNIEAIYPVNLQCSHILCLRCAEAIK